MGLHFWHDRPAVLVLHHVCPSAVGDIHHDLLLHGSLGERGLDLLAVKSKRLAGETLPGMTIKIIKELDDPLGVLRASIGGREDLGFYLTYRGNLAAVVTMLETVIAEARKQQEKQSEHDKRRN